MLCRVRVSQRLRERHPGRMPRRLLRSRRRGLLPVSSRHVRCGCCAASTNLLRQLQRGLLRQRNWVDDTHVCWPVSCRLRLPLWECHPAGVPGGHVQRQYLDGTWEYRLGALALSPWRVVVSCSHPGASWYSPGNQCCRAVPTPGQVGTHRATSAVVLYSHPPGCGCCETLMSGVLSMRRRLFRQRQSAHISGVRGAMPSRDVLPPWLDDSDRVSSRLVPSIAHTHFVALNSALHMLRARLGAALPCRLMSPLPTYRLYALTGAQGVGATRLESRRFVCRRVMPATTAR